MPTFHTTPDLFIVQVTWLGFEILVVGIEKIKETTFSSVFLRVRDVC